MNSTGFGRSSYAWILGHVWKEKKVIVNHICVCDCLVEVV
jgi:hypothetical protein